MMAEQTGSKAADIESALLAWGLSPLEAKTYLGLLGLGQASVQRLSETTGINRTTLYDILEALVKKGLAGHVMVGSARNYTAADPAVFLDALTAKERAVKDILPALRERKGIVGRKPAIEAYEGDDCIDAIHADILKEGKPLLSYGSYAILGRAMRYQSLDFRKKRVAAGIRNDAVSDSSAQDVEQTGDKDYKRLTSITINDALAGMPSWTYVYGDKVAILMYESKRLFGIIVKNASLAEKERMTHARWTGRKR